MSNVVAFPRRHAENGEAWNPMLTKRQVAGMLNRSTRWVELMHYEGIPREVGPGGRSLYPHDDVLRWWKERRAS